MTAAIIEGVYEAVRLKQGQYTVLYCIVLYCIVLYRSVHRQHPHPRVQDRAVLHGVHGGPHRHTPPQARMLHCCISKHHIIIVTAKLVWKISLFRRLDMDKLPRILRTHITNKLQVNIAMLTLVLFIEIAHS